jgi:hypothetical protein
MAQTWQQLLFAHWPLPAELLRPVLPAGVEPDTFEDRAWLSVVVFDLSNVHLRCWPPLPGLSAFAEVNLRTYVRCDGQPGVWFISLHCPNRLAMALARPWFLLPYQFAPLTVGDGCCRSDIFSATYCPNGAQFRAEKGSLDHWLTERYAYLTQSVDGALYRCDIHHEPWPLQPASARISCNRLVASHGGPALLHYAERIEALIWPLSPLRPQSA